MGSLRVADSLGNDEVALQHCLQVKREARYIDVGNTVIHKASARSASSARVAHRVRYDFKPLALIARRAELTRSPDSIAKDRWTALAHLSFARADACRSACSRFLL